MNSSTTQPRGISRRGFLGGIALGGFALASVGTLAGCAPAASTGSGAAGGKTTVRIASWMQFEPGRKEAWAKTLAAFNAQSEKITVEFIGWPFTEFSNQVLTQVQSGALEADLITTPPDLASRLVNLNAFSPVEQIAKAAGITPDAGLHRFITRDDHLYGVSVVTVTFGLLYNQKILGDAGLQPATNLEDWVAQAEALTKRPDSFGLIAANTMAEQANWWFQLQNWANAYDGVWAEGKTPKVTSEPIIKTLELFKRMFDAAIPQGSNDAQLMELMASGRGAQALLVSATANVLKAANEATYAELRSVPAPWASGKGTARVHPISLYSGSKNSEAASEFLTWLLKPENTAALMMESLDTLPPAPEVAALPDFASYLADLPWAEGYQKVVPVSPVELMGDFINANDEFGNIVLSHFQTALNGDASIADAMAKAQVELEALAGRLS